MHVPKPMNITDQEIARVLAVLEPHVSHLLVSGPIITGWHDLGQSPSGEFTRIKVSAFLGKNPKPEIVHIRLSNTHWLNDFAYLDIPY